MKYLTLLIFLLVVNINLLYSQSGWTLQNSGTTDALFDSYFFDANTGIIVGGTTATAVILRTTNSGNNWNPVATDTNILLRSITFINSSTGIIVGGNATSSIILRTTDSGLNWAHINIPDTFALRSVSFPSTGTGLIGYFVGFNGTAYKTFDGGINWTPLHTGLNTQILYAVHFTDPNTGTAVGGTQSDTAIIIRTTNGGANWFQQNPNTTRLLRSVYFLNNSTGFAVGNNGTIIKTTDGGNNWVIVQTNVPGLFLRDIYFENSSIGFIVGSGGKVLKTTNGGSSWDSLPSGTNKDLQAVFFLNELVGISVGFTGAIIHTNTGGVITAVHNPVSFFPIQYSLSQNYPDPFNPVTNIYFSVPIQGNVRLTIYNSLGQKTKELLNAFKEPGEYKIEFDGSNLSSGIYYYQIESGSFIQTKKMMLIK